MQYVPVRGTALDGTPADRMKVAAQDSSHAISARRLNNPSSGDQDHPLQSTCCNCKKSDRGGNRCLICGGALKLAEDRVGMVANFKVVKRSPSKPPNEAAGVGGVVDDSAASSAGPSRARSSNHEIGSPNTRALKKLMVSMTAAQRKQALDSWQVQFDAVASVEESLATVPPRSLLTDEAEKNIMLMGQSGRDNLRERSLRLVPILQGNRAAATTEYFDAALLAVSVIMFIDAIPRPPPPAEAPAPTPRGFNRDPNRCTTFEMFEDILGSNLAFSTDKKDYCSQWLAEQGLETATKMLAFLQLEPTGRSRATVLAPMLSTGEASLVVTSLARFFS